MDASPYYYAYTRGLPRCAEHAEVRLVKQPAYVESTLLKRGKAKRIKLNALNHKRES